MKKKHRCFVSTHLYYWTLLYHKLNRLVIVISHLGKRLILIRWRVNGTLGRSPKVELPLLSLQVDPEGVFVLPPASVQELHMKVQPWRAGSRFLYVNAVDVEQRRLITSWLVCLNILRPVLSKVRLFLEASLSPWRRCLCCWRFALSSVVAELMWWTAQALKVWLIGSHGCLPFVLTGPLWWFPGSAGQ